jgi:O-antigen/teichoic acid export membrane protein
MALASVALRLVRSPDSRIVGRLASVPAFFGLRVASALLLLKLSAHFLTVSAFAVFTQFMLFAALLNLAAVAGMQNGLIRQSAAAGDREALRKVSRAAFLIWSRGIPLLLVPIALLSGTISHVLAGTDDHWLAVIAIAMLAIAAGPGQIWCAILSGRKHVPGSLAAQAAGLVAATSLAAWMIVRGDPVAAVIGFAGCSLVTMALAWLFASRLGLVATAPSSAPGEIGVLLRYSAAFLATAGFTSLSMFALRYLYRESFGAVPLGYWIAANRISDMSTQLLGLFMIQFFVPHLTMIEDRAERRNFAVRCWAVAAAIMAAGLLIFTAAAQPLVHIFLSDAYLPAIPYIRAYMAGDLLRVAVSLAMFSALAGGRPGRYAALDMFTVGLMAVIMTLFVLAGDVRAPQFAYVAAYATSALLVAALFVLRRHAGGVAR